VGVAGDQARVARGDQPGRLGPDGRIVGGRVAALADRGVGQGAVDPEHGGDPRYRGDQRDRDDQDAEPDQPALTVMAQQRPDPRHEGQEAQHERRRERHRQPPQPARHHAVEQARSQESARIPVAPPDAFEQRAGVVAGHELRQDLPDDVVPERRVDRGPGVVERVVLIELMAVHHPDQPAAVAGRHHQVTGQAHVGQAQTVPEQRYRLLVPGELPVVVSRG
jgi:hypothetical protein